MTTRAEFINIHMHPTPIFKTNCDMTVSTYIDRIRNGETIVVFLPKGTEIYRLNYSQFDNGYSMRFVNVNNIAELKKTKNKKQRWFECKYCDMEFSHFQGNI